MTSAKHQYIIQNTWIVIASSVCMIIMLMMIVVMTIYSTCFISASLYESCTLFIYSSFIEGKCIFNNAGIGICVQVVFNILFVYIFVYCTALVRISEHSISYWHSFFIWFWWEQSCTTTYLLLLKFIILIMIIFVMGPFPRLNVSLC